MAELSIVGGTLALAEVSGAAMISGDRLLLVSDEHGLFVLNNARKALLKGDVRQFETLTPRDKDGKKIEVTDLEDVT